MFRAVVIAALGLLALAAPEARAQYPRRMSPWEMQATQRMQMQQAMMRAQAMQFQQMQQRIALQRMQAMQRPMVPAYRPAQPYSPGQRPGISNQQGAAVAALLLAAGLSGEDQPLAVAAFMKTARGQLVSAAMRDLAPHIPAEARAGVGALIEGIMDGKLDFTGVAFSAVKQRLKDQLGKIAPDLAGNDFVPDYLLNLGKLAGKRGW